MIDKRTNFQCYLVLIFIKLLGAQEVPNTSRIQGFSDSGAMGISNFGSGRFGNPTSNYPTNSFFPYGNQNNNMQRPQQGSGLSYPNQGDFQYRPQGYPNQQGYQNSQGYPYQGDSMSPSPNYQRPQYPNQNIQNTPVQGGYPNQDAYPYQGDNNARYPNYQRPSYPNSPGDGSIMYPDESRPYQNGGMPTNQGGAGQSYQYPVQDNQYPSQGNFQGNGNSNDINSNFRPDDLSNLPNTNTHFPDGPNQYRPNQYYPQTNYQNQNYRPVQGQPGNFPNYPSNYNPYTNIQFPTNYPGGTNVDPSTIQYNNQGIPNPGGSGNVLPGPSVNPSFNDAFQNQPQLPNNQGNIPNYNDNDSVAILGKPVTVPSTTTLPGQAVLSNSTTDAATQKKCVQDCPTTSEYDPICGTDNVTYINTDKFNCAQECGIAVHLQQRGRCPGDIVHSNLNQT